MQIAPGESLQARNSLALQATARALATVGSESELLQALAWAREERLPVVPLGEGSNVVLAGDVEALVLCQSSRGIQIVDEDQHSATLRVAAGENWHQLVRWSLQKHYYGLENLALIPGTVGAAPIQNIGAYGVELQAFVVAVHAVDIASGSRHTLSNPQCQFAYRDSVFKGRLRDQLLITAVDLRLSRQAALRTEYPALAAELDGRQQSSLTPMDVFEAVVRVRSSKLPDPAVLPNAGSFFKNPVVTGGLAAKLAGDFPGLPRYEQGEGSIKLPAAWMIDYCGWKGYREEGVGVHPEHALVLVNYTARDGARLLELADNIQRSVQDTFGVSLEIEPRVYGQAP